MGYQALLFCPDEKTARVVTQVLNELDFSVEPAGEPFAAVKKLMAQHFDAIVVDCENEQNATLLFKSARNSSSNQSSLAVAVVEGQAGVAKAFRIGANLVLTKPINIEQSKGTLRVARGLLRKGADAAKTAGPQPPPASESRLPSPPAPTVPSARPTAPTLTPRPAGAAASMPRSAGPTLSIPKSAPAPLVPAAADPSGALRMEDDQANKLDATGAAVPESTHDRAPSAAATIASELFEEPGPSKAYPWRPISKNAGPMASALQKAAEAAGKSTPAEASTKPPGLRTPATTNQGPRLSGVSGGQSATAPAPAKETPRVAPLGSSEAGEPVSALQSATRIESKPKPSTQPLSAPAAAPVIAAPSFTTLDSKDAEASTGGSKKFLIAIAAIALVAIAGYFVYPRFHGKGEQSIKQVQPQPPAPAPQASPAPPTTAPAPAPDDSATTPAVAQQPAPQVSAPPPKPSPATAAASSKSASPIAEDKTVVLMKSDPVVRPTVSRPALPSSAPPDQSVPLAPSALGIAGGSASDLSAIASAPVKVPKPLPQVVNISQGVSQGLLLKKVQPTYPPQALQMRIAGAVQLEATISKDGSITNLKALSGQPLLTRAAMDAVRQWKYKPYYLNTEPVEVQTQITINFRLPK